MRNLAIMAAALTAPCVAHATIFTYSGSPGASVYRYTADNYCGCSDGYRMGDGSFDFSIDTDTDTFALDAVFKIPKELEIKMSGGFAPPVPLHGGGPFEMNPDGEFLLKAARDLSAMAVIDGVDVPLHAPGQVILQEFGGLFGGYELIGILDGDVACEIAFGGPVRVTTDPVPEPATGALLGLLAMFGPARLATRGRFFSSA